MQSDTPSPRRETDGDILARMGDDGEKWAREFLLHVPNPDDIGEDWLVGWFANAIEAGRSAARQGSPDGLADRLEALSYDCDNTDGWEGAAPDLRAAAKVLRARQPAGDVAELIARARQGAADGCLPPSPLGDAGILDELANALAAMPAPAITEAMDILDGIRQWYACTKTGDAMPEALYERMNTCLTAALGQRP